jgi:hypothetical protein
MCEASAPLPLRAMTLPPDGIFAFRTRYGAYLRSPAMCADGPAMALGRAAVSAAAAEYGGEPLERRQLLGSPCQANEAIFSDRAVVPRQTRPTPLFDHSGLRSCWLSSSTRFTADSSRQGRPSRHGKLGRRAMTEIVAALLVFLGISIFLAFDACRIR